MCDERDAHVGNKIHILHSMLKRRADAMISDKNAKDLSGSSMYLLEWAAKKTAKGKKLYQKDFEKNFGMTKSGISRSLDLLEKNSLIRRVADEEDSRKKQIIVTEEGLKVTQEMNAEVKATEALLVKDLTKEECETMKRLLNRMIDNIKSEEGTKK